MSSMVERQCCFCNTPADDVIGRTSHWFLIEDKYPVNPGHMLVVINRHVPNCLSLSEREAYDLFQIINMARVYARKKYRATGFNIGINEGTVAGQTIPHLHVHIIPRYEGDVVDPRGGVRNLKPPLVNY